MPYIKLSSLLQAYSKLSLNYIEKVLYIPGIYRYIPGLVDIEQRKLISFGRSSYVLSLPQPWIRKHSLEKGSNLAIEELNEGLLIVPQHLERKSVDKEIHIKTDNKPADIVKREIASAYIRGFNTFVISGYDVKDKSREIRSLIQYLMALEIVEESATRIVAKDFLNIKEVSIGNFIRKIDTILRSMFNDIKSTDKALLRNAVSRDEDINRLTFLIQRAIKLSLKDPGTAKQISETPETLLEHWRMATHLERIGDNLKEIAHLIVRKEHDEKFQKAIEILLQGIEGQYLLIMKAYHEKDEEIALHATLKKNEIMEKGNKLMHKSKDPDFQLLVDRIKQLAFTVNHFARIVYI